MMNVKKFFGSMLLAIAGGIIAVLLYAKLDNNKQTVIVKEEPVAKYINLPAAPTDTPCDFTEAAEMAVHAVVHVKTKSMRESGGYSFYEYFFGRPERDPQPVVGFGSGVIISSDGYIVTNNHVIEGSDAIEVVLNDKRSMDAELVGRDPSTDLAVLKIKLDNLPFLRYGDSDALRLGEWVLAIGNPYNLTSTVTAGIVSAKARNIGILREQMAIESFIQTDAAVNPGNSGGALVNTRGELIGINAAIASRTGAFTGYSFAIPERIARKIVEDIMEYGTVQRALLGVTIVEVNSEVADEFNLEKLEGVLVTALTSNGAAHSAGIDVGDVILSINGVKVNSPAELQEQVSRYRPNDKVSVLLRKKNKEIQKDVILQNLEGGTGLVEKEEPVIAFGASFEKAGSDDLKKLGINHGVKVVDIGNGKFRKHGIKDGFIVTEINDKPVHEVEDIKNIVNKSEGGVFIEGIYPDGLIAYYAIRL